MSRPAYLVSASRASWRRRPPSRAASRSHSYRSWTSATRGEKQGGLAGTHSHRMSPSLVREGVQPRRAQNKVLSSGLSDVCAEPPLPPPVRPVGSCPRAGLRGRPVGSADGGGEVGGRGRKAAFRASPSGQTSRTHLLGHLLLVGLTGLFALVSTSHCLMSFFVIFFVPCGEA